VEHLHNNVSLDWNIWVGTDMSSYKKVKQSYFLIMIKVADEAIQRNYLKENIIIIIIISKFVKRHVCLQKAAEALK